MEDWGIRRLNRKRGRLFTHVACNGVLAPELVAIRKHDGFTSQVT